MSERTIDKVALGGVFRDEDEQVYSCFIHTPESSVKEFSAHGDTPIEVVERATTLVRLINASEGMSNEDAVKALENYEEIKKALKCFPEYRLLQKLLAKLEGK